MMAHFIKEYKDIQILSSINGLPLPQIEKRAQKISDNTSDSEWRYRSFDGFVGDDETFVQRLEKDWKLVESMGVTHLQLASSLKLLIENIENIRKEKQYGPMTTIKVNYTYAEQPSFLSTHILPLFKKTPTINQHIITEYISPSLSSSSSSSSVSSIRLDDPSLSFPSQLLSITKQSFNGYQFSLFFNSEENLATQKELNIKWNEEYTVKNEVNGLEVKINKGIIQYIQYFGFYEGGEDNPYRVDPVVLVGILTGYVNSSYLLFLNNFKKEKQIKTLDNEKNTAQIRMADTTISVEERNWLEREIQRIETQISEIKNK